MKRNLLLAILFSMLIGLPLIQDNVENTCETDMECEHSLIDKQIKLVNNTAKQCGWIDETKEID